MIWHGWSDPALTALGSVKYFDQVLAHDPGARDYLRMFMMPGVLHCGGGPGPDSADWPSVLADWVENGKAPERVIARKVAQDGAVTRTRPLEPRDRKNQHQLRQHDHDQWRQIEAAAERRDDAANRCEKPERE